MYVWDENIENLVCIWNKFMLWLKAMPTMRFFIFYGINCMCQIKSVKICKMKMKNSYYINMTHQQIETITTKTKSWKTITSIAKQLSGSFQLIFV